MWSERTRQSYVAKAQCVNFTYWDLTAGPYWVGNRSYYVDINPIISRTLRTAVAETDALRLVSKAYAGFEGGGSELPLPAWPSQQNAVFVHCLGTGSIYVSSSMICQLCLAVCSNASFPYAGLQSGIGRHCAGARAMRQATRCVVGDSSWQAASSAPVSASAGVAAANRSSSPLESGTSGRTAISFCAMELYNQCAWMPSCFALTAAVLLVSSMVGDDRHTVAEVHKDRPLSGMQDAMEPPAAAEDRAAVKRVYTPLFAFLRRTLNEDVRSEDILVRIFILLGKRSFQQAAMLNQRLPGSYTNRRLAEGVACSSSSIQRQMRRALAAGISSLSRMYTAARLGRAAAASVPVRQAAGHWKWQVELAAGRCRAAAAADEVAVEGRLLASSAGLPGCPQRQGGGIESVQCGVKDISPYE
uniref:Alpha,alpha-trehalase n=1 Tax=Macrostomum lignano TaxID=282301 RepID=A0A1I8IUA3_9PLAT